MPVDPPITFLSQGIDYLGFLNAKLRDLRGWSTLLNELIQNGDDAIGTKRLTIDLTDEAFVVENDGLFSDCGAVQETRCRFDSAGDGRKCCDFHAFRRVASGHKRLEEGTTGAFGIGFVSVYQVTDQPSLRSGHWHWRLRPDGEESRRIQATRSDEPFKGTRFDLPWARENTPLRAALGVEPVPSDVVERVYVELQDALVLAAPFLKRLNKLELRRRGQDPFVVQCERDEAGQILVGVNGETHLWKWLAADFGAEAARLRERYGPRIEDKRKSAVTVAVPTETDKAPGRLYATLPTEHEIALPLLVNADFFPSSDRKRILFDADYQGEWNRAAIRAAASAVSGALIDLRDWLEPGGLWQLLDAAKESQRQAQAGKAEKGFAAFWEQAAPHVKAGQFVRTSAEAWVTPAEARLLQSAKEEGALVPLLEALGQHVVADELQPFSNLLRDNDVGVKYLALDDVSAALKSAGLDRVREERDVPAWLRERSNRHQLGAIAERLLERVAKDARLQTRQHFVACSVARSVDGRYSPPAVLHRADEETRALFGKINLTDYWLDPGEPEEIAEWVSVFSCRDAVRVLSSAGDATLAKTEERHPGWVVSLIGWFASRREQIAADTDLRQRLCALRIWPAAGKLASLDELSVPGNFDDPLGLAKVVDRAVSSLYRSFLTQDLGASELTLRSYLTAHVPRAFA